MRHTLWGAAFVLAVAALTVLPGTAVAVRPAHAVFTDAMTVRATARPAARPSVDPKLQYQLGVLAQTGPASVQASAKKLEVPVRSGAVSVVVQTKGRPDRAALVAAGARIQAQAGGLVQASVPVGKLQRLAAVPGVRFVRMPSYQELDEIRGEEVGASNAAASIQKGWTGKGVKVAVIDGGFTGYQQRVAEGELPANVKTQSFCPTSGFTPSFSGGEHGTAVGEIIHEMAPNATLYLICYESEVTLLQAEQYAKSQGVQIITHSGSTFNNGRGDGAPTPGTEGAVVADARQSGILWVNSAGNSAQRHWSGTFTDPDGNGYNNFNAAPLNEGNGFPLDHNEDVCAFLRWDEWPAAINDFDLQLVTSNFTVVAQSASRQTGTQPPIEQFCFQNTGNAAAFFLVIHAARAVTGTPPRFDIFVRNVDPPLQYIVPVGSVGDPGSSQFSFTAGAVCWQNNALEPYSGQGPTIDGRLKPDIAGQDSNSGVTYGNFTACGQSGFTGTSASAPAVAGAAALVKEENPSFTADQIQAFMQQNAGDLGTPGPDNQFGYGKLTVPTPTGQGPTAADSIPPTVKALKSSGVRGKSVKLYTQASDNTGEVRLVDTVMKGARTLATLKTGFAATKPATTYYILWRAPLTLSGTFAHCVQAFDHTGNKSKRSCATLIVKKK